ncbi:MAG: YadA-like family protein, partial [Acidaminococcaceae bacterium]|nr:YadA-like family protein [Acidaminococcaceae bacterium]
TEGSTAWGYQTTAGKETIDGTEYSGTYATAFGQGSKAIGLASTAFGFKSEAEGKNSTAFGDSSKAEAENSLAALGGIVEKDATNSAAIGKGAKVTVADAVALGSGSVADTANTISVGSSSLQRKIVNVAAGTADTDAVNFKQLSDKLDKTVFNDYKAETAATLGLMQNAITQNADDISDLQTNKLDKAVYEADKADTKAALDGKANVALDNITEDGKTVIKDLAKGAVNVVGDGPVSVAKSDVSGVDTYTVSVKTDGKVESANTGIVTGGTVYDYLHGDTVELGKGSKATGTQSIAIGFGNKVSGNNSGAIGDPNTVEGDNSWAFGNNNQIPGSNSIVLGNKNNVSGSNTFVLGNNVTADVDNAVVLGDGSKAEADAVSVGSDGGERQIKHVKDGTDDTDAATVGQLKALAGGTGAGLEEVTHRISNLDSKVNKVGAGAAALAALHPLDTDNKFTMAAGFGNYRNANAMALGMFYRPTDQVMFSVGGAMGNGENMINAGVSFALDKGVGTSKAAMARTIKAQGDRIAEQDAKIQSLEAYNAKLEERLAALEAKIGK